MRIARALLVAPLVPLLAVGILGLGVGYRSIVDLAQFVLVWALFLYPLVVALSLGAHALGQWLGLKARWHFGLGGLVAGMVLGLAWVYPEAPVTTALFCVAAGIVGAASLTAFWHLAVRARPRNKRLHSTSRE